MRKIAFLIVSLIATYACACTNFIVAKGASTDGSVICTYNADDYGMFQNLCHYPAGVHPKGTMRDVYDWDTNVYHGQIPEAEVTYNVIGNINISSKASGAFVGGIVGTATSTIDDCSVEGSTGSTIEGSTVGGLAGTSTRTAKENANTVTDSTVTGVTVKSDDNGGQAGGLVGKATNPVTVTGNTVHDVTVSAEAGKADALVGGVGGDVTASSNTTDTNVTVVSKPSEDVKVGSEENAYQEFAALATACL